MTEAHSEMGTRVLLLLTGGALTLTKGEDDVITLVAQYGHARVTLLLAPVEALSLIGSLAVAAKPGSGKAFIEVAAETPPALVPGESTP